jgi:4-azaleucine resistance transporter AzlC
MAPFSTSTSAFWGGFRAFVPVMLGAIPFGLIYGVSAAESGMTTIEGAGLSAIMIAGAAQLVTIELLKTEAPVWLIVFSVVLINLRFIIYSASLAPHFRSLSSRWKLLLAYPLTDEPYALSISYFNQYPQMLYKHWYYLGSGFALWITWITSSAIGLEIGSIIPKAWSLDFVIPLIFIGLAVPAVKNKALGGSAIVAIVVALIAAPLPNNIGLMLAVVCSIATGVILEKFE